MHRIRYNVTLNMDLKKLHIEEIGPVFFKKSSRAKYVVISVSSQARIQVTVPKTLPYRLATNFVYKKIPWIRKQLKKCEIARINHESQQFPTTVTKQETRRILKERLDKLAQEHHFKFNRIFIRNQKTRWGSCSSKNNLSLNVKLLKLPQELIDYVLLHELLHTRIKNHSQQFWRALDELTGDAKLLDKKLKKYRIELL